MKTNTVLLVLVGAVAAFFLYQKYGKSVGSGQTATNNTTTAPQQTAANAPQTTVNSLFDAFNTIFQTGQNLVTGIQKSL